MVKYRKADVYPDCSIRDSGLSPGSRRIKAQCLQLVTFLKDYRSSPY
jgi:hypothetical protein